MKYSPKNAEPAGLTAHRAAASEEVVSDFGNLPTLAKAALKDSLLREQGFVCCYCGRAIGIKRTDAHIEHFYPQCRFRDRDLDYGNLFASCGPKYTDGVHRKTCGGHKGNWWNEKHHIKPSDPGCDLRFRYGPEGGIFPKDQAAENMIAVLNLSDPGLNAIRRTLLQGIEGEIEAGNTPEELRAAYDRCDAQGRMPGFGHAVVLYLQEEFGI